MYYVFRLWLLLLIIIHLLVHTCSAASFHVNTLEDLIDINPGDGLCETIDKLCSLRAAVMESNEFSGLDEIILPVGEILVEIEGMNEQDGLTGDFDITESVTITGSSEQSTIINANQLDRIFEIIPGEFVNLDLSDVTLTNGLVNMGSVESRSGGAIKSSATSQINLQNISFEFNSATKGGAIFNQSTLIGNQVKFTQNSSTGSGGAINNQGSPFIMHLTDCYFELNTGHSSSVLSNTADLSGIRGEASLNRCTVVNNHSINTGVILNNMHTDFEVNNSTISNNQTSDGVLFNDGGAILYINNSTIVNNQASGIVEVHHNDQFIFLKNTVLAGNEGTPATNCTLRLTSEGGNYFGDLTGCMPTLHISDIVGDNDPELSELVTMGQPWQQIHLPLSNSELIDAGLNENCLPADQLLNNRPLDNDFDGDAKCTIGAVEMTDVIFKNGVNS